ncbi:MAG: acyltransferase family protein [Pirellulales bacterium]
MSSMATCFTTAQPDLLCRETHQLWHLRHHTCRTARVMRDDTLVVDVVPDSCRTPCPKTHYYGFDYLRAFMALAVVATHAGLFKEIAAYKIVLYNVFCLAVPTFMLMSLFLFCVRARNASYVFQRLERLLVLFAFWSLLYLFVLRERVDFHFSNPINSLAFIVTGGTPFFWFFSCLAGMTLICHFTIRLPGTLLGLFTAVSALALTALPGLAVANPTCWPFVAVYNPLNFLPFVFIAAWMSQQQQKAGTTALRASTSGIAALCCLYLAISTLEWMWLPDISHVRYSTNTIPSYTRVSVVIGAYTLLNIAFLLNSNRAVPFLIRLLADYSLGIFCVHCFFIMADILPTKPPLARFVAAMSLSMATVGFTRYAVKKGVI